MSLFDDPVFKAGDKVVCKHDGGYHCLQEGNVYEVLMYEQRCPTIHFTFPAYVKVQAGDRQPWCHASRFELYKEKDHD